MIYPNITTKETARLALIEALAESDRAYGLLESAAASLMEAQTAQQHARQIEKDGEAAIIAANPNDIFTPRKTSPEIKEAYLREVLQDTYAARALAEKALTAAEYEHKIATTQNEKTKARVAGLTAILNSFN